MDAYETAVREIVRTCDGEVRINPTGQVGVFPRRTDAEGCRKVLKFFGIATTKVERSGEFRFGILYPPQAERRPNILSDVRFMLEPLSAEQAAQAISDVFTTARLDEPVLLRKGGVPKWAKEKRRRPHAKPKKYPESSLEKRVVEQVSRPPREKSYIIPED